MIILPIHVFTAIGENTCIGIREKKMARLNLAMLA